MNEVIENILTRRSIRKFTDKPVDKDILNELVQAALNAPTGMGRQTWKFTVITNQDAIKKVLSNGSYYAIQRKGQSFWQRR